MFHQAKVKAKIPASKPKVEAEMEAVATADSPQRRQWHKYRRNSGFLARVAPAADEEPSAFAQPALTILLSNW